MYFSSKKDIGFTVTIWGSLMIITSLYLFGGEPIGNQLITANSVAGYIIGILIVALLLWMWFQKGYQVKGDVLSVRMGPYNKSIRINDIKKISRIDNASSKFSLSVEKLTIYYGRYSEIRIAPKNEDVFISSLVDKNPDIQVEEITSN